MITFKMTDPIETQEMSAQIQVDAFPDGLAITIGRERRALSLPQVSTLMDMLSHAARITEKHQREANENIPTTGN